MASTDATAIPVKNQAYRVTFPILDADGDLVTGATGLDSEVSKDGGTFADATSEATEIATASGMYYLDLTATEMNADTVAIIVKTISSGAKTTPIVLYPRDTGDLKVTMETGGIVAASFAAGAIDAAAIATGAIDADAIAADAVTEIQAGLATAAALDTVDNFLDTEIAAILAAVDTEIATLQSDLTAVKAKTDNLPTDPADQSLVIAATDAIYNRIGAPAGASVSADIAAIEAQTDDIGAAGAGLTAVPWNPAWDAEVQSEVDDALVAQRLDELLNADSDIDGAAPPTVGSAFHELMTKTAGSFTYDQATDSLEAVRDRGDSAWGASGSESRNREGTAQAGGASTITLDASASAVNDFYKNQKCFIDSGTGAGQCEIIASYVGATKVATMAASWATTPDVTSHFRILPLGTIPGASAPTAAAVSLAVCDELASTKRTVDRVTGDVKHYRLDGTTVRGTLRPTEIDANTQGLVPQ